MSVISPHTDSRIESTLNPTPQSPIPSNYYHYPPKPETGEPLLLLNLIEANHFYLFPAVFQNDSFVFRIGRVFPPHTLKKRPFSIRLVPRPNKRPRARDPTLSTALEIIQTRQSRISPLRLRGGKRTVLKNILLRYGFRNVFRGKGHPIPPRAMSLRYPSQGRCRGLCRGRRRLTSARLSWSWGFLFQCWRFSLTGIGGD